MEPGTRVINTRTGETGVVAPERPKECAEFCTPVIYETDEWGNVWFTETRKLEVLPGDTP